MNDIKSVVSVIKILERTIGILENCNDVGEIPGLTRKRIIEMLNKATLEIYFLDNARTSVVSDEKISENEQVIEISDIVEETIPKETPEVQPALETVEEEYIPEEEIIDTVPEEEYIPEAEMLTEEENIGTEEDVPEGDTISEDSIFQKEYGFDKPLFEWEIPESEPVRETNKDDEINILKLQLEEERKRLEQELQSWQEEKRKRDDEMLATQKLLEVLQQQAAISRVQQNQTPQPVIRQTQPVQQSNQSSQQVQQPQQPKPQQSQRVQQPSQAVKTPPVKTEPAKKEESQESATLLDSFGSKKVLHENFESESVVNHISTPVSSLPKAIGINDKFRFIKELFGGDSDLYNETIKKLDAIGSLVSAISYIESNFSWDKNSDSVKQLITLIRRRYM
jgi:hypothetical protein